MKKPGFLILILLLITASCSKKEAAQESILDLSLSSIDHGKVALREISKNKGTVMLFLQPECPFCNSYGKTLRSLDSLFQLQQVKVYAIVAGKNYPDSEINAYRQKFNLQFPFLLDPDFELTRSLKAHTTPQAFLMDSKGNTLYHGMIDNWGYEIGKARPRATEFYLIDAVNNFLEGKQVVPDSTKAIGCLIQ